MRNIKNSTNVRQGNFRVQVMVADVPHFLASTKAIDLVPAHYRHKGFKTPEAAARAIERLGRKMETIQAQVVEIAPADLPEKLNHYRQRMIVAQRGRVPQALKA